MPTTYICPMPNCGREAEFIAFSAEEVVTQGDQDPATIRKAPVQRNVLVRCPVHGKKIWRHIGHHRSSRPKGKPGR